MIWLCVPLFPHSACAPIILGSISCVRWEGMDSDSTQLEFWIMQTKFISQTIFWEGLTTQWLQKLCEVMKLCSKWGQTAGLQCNTLCDLSISSCQLGIKIPLLVEWVVWIRWLLRACLVLNLYENVKCGGKGHVWHIYESRCVCVDAHEWLLTCSGELAVHCIWSKENSIFHMLPANFWRMSG